MLLLCSIYRINTLSWSEGEPNEQMKVCDCVQLKNSFMSVLVVKKWPEGRMITERFKRKNKNKTNGGKGPYLADSAEPRRPVVASTRLRELLLRPVS